MEDREIQRIREYLTGYHKDLLNIKGIEKKAGVPRNTLSNLLLIDRKIPRVHLDSILTVLESLGYKRLTE